LADLRRGREERNHTILERLAQLGIDVSMDEVLARAGDGSVGRPHIAGVMGGRGYVPDIATAFELYLGHGAPASVSRKRLGIDAPISLARAARALPPVAHPHPLALDGGAQLGDLLRHLRSLRLVGVETHRSATEPDRRRI